MTTISIVTPVLNADHMIAETVESVVQQSAVRSGRVRLQYIIQDGGSTDGTVDIIRKYEEKIDYWVSEKDEGISDAFNKGIRCSTGELIGIINSDDWYQVDSVNAIVDFYRTLESQERNNFISFGNLLYAEKDVLQFGDNNYSRVINYHMPFLNHPSVFVAKNVYSRVGLFNKNFKLAMDFEFLKRCHKNGIIFNYINKTIVNMRLGGVSDKCKDEALRESISISDNKSITLFYSFYLPWIYRFSRLKSILNK